MRFQVVLYFLLTLSIYGCSKNSTAARDTTPPSVTINTPVNSESFTSGQTVHISGTASDNNAISEIHIVVTDLATGATYIHAHVYPNTPSADFTQDFTAVSGISYQIEIIAVDRSVNQTATSVNISCN